MIHSSEVYKTGKSDQGFTLVELMIAMVLSLFLVGGVILIFLSTRIAATDTGDLSRLQENVRFSSDFLVRDIRNAGFRDEMSITIGQNDDIRTAFATLNVAGDELTIRYAGRGNCGQEFDDYRVVENTYFVNTEAELSCRGRDVGAGTESLVKLLSGIATINFTLMMADGATERTGAYVCEENPALPSNEQCLGVKLELVVEGLRELNDPTNRAASTVELFSTFRNPAIGLIYSDV